VRAAVIVPSYQVEPVIGDVVAGLRRSWPADAVLVVDDGSSDGTARAATEAGGTVLRHDQNRGKGAALRTGLAEARERGFDVAVTVDGDGQHPPDEALRMHHSAPDPAALVVGVRDLAGAGAPRANQLSNGFSNLVLSLFTGLWLGDTQCGLRRYPVAATLALEARENGYGYEAEVLIRAAAARVPIVERPIRVVYPEERISHFHVVRDPARIVARVVQTTLAVRTRKLRGALFRTSNGAGA
jgi:glycosyltransferase involved in cell wall biosynthesis